MASRKDSKGRRLKDGESERKDGRYSYRYIDTRTGKRSSIYAKDLFELRDKEKKIEKDMEDNILTDVSIKKLTLNELFDEYIGTRQIAETTKANYIHTWNNRVRNEIGNLKVVQIRPSQIKLFYAGLGRAGYAHSTIKTIHNMIYPALELALEDDIIRKNPARKALGDYGCDAKERVPLTEEQEQKLLDFVKNSNIYNIYYPMLVVMLGTGVRCGEMIGLTWKDIDFSEKLLNIDHQLIYKNYGDGCYLHITTPKTNAGIRTIPMSKRVCKAFEEQRKINFMLGIDRSVEIDGYNGFVFTAKSGRPLMPSAVNNVLYNIVKAYNNAEEATAKRERRKAKFLPKFSAHVTRHTACTRMAENGMDVKVLQYVMGHANIDVTMQVYNHITDISRVEKEIAKMDLMAGNY